MANGKMGLLGRKLGMTQIFDDAGAVIPVTVVETGPCKVLQVKTSNSADGYDAIQLSLGIQKEQRIAKAQKGHFDAANAGSVRHVKEIRLVEDEAGKFERGQTLTVDSVFNVGDAVDVSGLSKGCGFAGVVKKFGFAGFIRTHGTHEFFRHGGSIGCRLTPGHVMKGKKMPGQMGAKRVTIQNLTIVRVDAERNLLFIRGGLPGSNGNIVTIRFSVKQ